MLLMFLISFLPFNIAALFNGALLKLALLFFFYICQNNEQTAFFQFSERF